MSCRFVDSFRAGPGWNCSKAVWHIPLLSVQWINSWWWTGELSETCRVSWQNKFVKLVHLVSFITKTFVAMYGHMNVKFFLGYSEDTRDRREQPVFQRVLTCDIFHSSRRRPYAPYLCGHCHLGATIIKLRLHTGIKLYHQLHFNW
jgi:hypothetical protein